MTSTTDLSANELLLAGQRVALVGQFAGMSKREAQQAVREHGGTVVERPDAATTLLVVGEEGLPFADGTLEEAAGDAVREALDRGTLEVIGESQLWDRLGLVELQQHIRSLYTPTMLARLLGVKVSTLRHWQRRGWIVPVREVRKLAYFDFQEVATARRLNELLASGMSPAAIERKLAAFARFFPNVKRPLAQLSIIVEGKQLLVRQAGGLLDPRGQLRFDFGAARESSDNSPESLMFAPQTLAFHGVASLPISPGEMLHAAGQLEDEGQVAAAADMYRAAMAAGGPTAETCFLLAELLYQMHDLAGARERYYTAVELDEDYVEARANLGCVLAELGETDLAVAAFQGALAFHDDYSDVHYHLARLLDDMGQADESEAHWRTFLRLDPASPWADEARLRLSPDE